jgi:hypothetical protein
MTRSTLGALLMFLLTSRVPLMAQIQPIPNLNIQPVPIPGGDLVPGYGIVNSFVPGPIGQTPPYDPIGAEPNVITNFKGLVVMGYTSGLTTMTSDHKQYAVITDIRVYKGAYTGGKAGDFDQPTAGATMSALSGNPENYNDPENSVFVEI